ncbi:MAG: AAA family ATPase [Opitutaceae bacterium]|jgi:energy-coupling factor transporter ATP-binding protein EcfA2
MNDLPLTRFRIAQFRGLQELTLEGLGRINLLVGANNAGKTSTLDAISLFCRPLDIANWRDTARRREVKSARTPESEPIKWLFPQFLQSALPNPHGIWLHGEGVYPARKLVANYDEFEEFGEPMPQVRERTPEDEETNEPDRGLNIRVVADYAQRVGGQLLPTADGQSRIEFRIIDNRRNAYPTAVGEPSMEVAFISPHSHRTTQDTAWYVGRAIEREDIHENFRADLLEVLKQIDPDVLDIDAVPKGKTTVSLSVKHKLTGRTPIHAFGDGFQRALLIASVIPAVRNGVLLIDELESALHISVLGNVLSVLKWAADKYNVQVFATTHSLEGVDAVLKAFKGAPEHLRAYRLERKAKSNVVTRYPGLLLQETRCEMGFEIR